MESLLSYVFNSKFAVTSEANVSTLICMLFGPTIAYCAKSDTKFSNFRKSVSPTLPEESSINTISTIGAVHPVGDVVGVVVDGVVVVVDGVGVVVVVVVVVEVGVFTVR